MKTSNRQHWKAAGYVSAVPQGNGQVLLTDSAGKREIWFCNKGHASFGLVYRNTHLEFARSA